MNFNFEENDAFVLLLGLPFRIISCEKNVYGYYLYTKATIEICSFSPCIDLNFLSNRKNSKLYDLSQKSRDSIRGTFEASKYPGRRIAFGKTFGTKSKAIVESID